MRIIIYKAYLVYTYNAYALYIKVRVYIYNAYVLCTLHVFIELLQKTRFVSFVALTKETRLSRNQNTVTGWFEIARLLLIN